jgi:transcription elongation factor GreB
VSRAFTKERDDAPEPEIALPQRSHPNLMTPAGMTAFERKRAGTSDGTQRAALDRVIASAVVVGPPERRDRVAFGATVVVSGAADADQTFTIVGEDEADVRAGKIGHTSPLAKALLDAKAGQHVTWHRPAGDRRLTIRSIAYADTA